MAIQVKEEHIHNWVNSWDLSEKRCECGKLLVSREEYERRTEEYNNYFAWVTTTDSYKDYQAIRDIFRQVREGGDFKNFMGEILKAVDERLLQDDYQARRPRFPDPSTNIYEITG